MKPDSFSGWLDYLNTMDPSQIELGLDRVSEVYARLAPSLPGKIVVVAGTNGKGSTVAALEAMLGAAGHRIATYTSPHLQRFTERIRVNGSEVSEAALISAFEQVYQAKQETPLTYFEFTTLAAISVFADVSPDVSLFEVGLGGRLDAVNILDPDVSVVTGVALDHTDWLGPDLESIGREKAGVYRHNRPAIYAALECPDSVSQAIKRLGAMPLLRGEDFDIDVDGASVIFRNLRNGSESVIDLGLGSLPVDALAAALSAYEALQGQIDQQAIVALKKCPGERSVPANKLSRQQLDCGCRS